MTNNINIGLTFYGGVSLAVYEAGVAEEFIRFVQFCKTAGKPLFKQDSQVEIGVLTGSSAGGLASVLMSATLVNSLDPLTHIENMRRVWFEIADISNLQYRDDRKIRSLLDNDILEKEIQAFLQIRDVSKLRAGTGDLKIMLTGTNMQGFFDAIPIEDDFVPANSFADKAFTTTRHTEVFEFSGRDIWEAGESSGREKRARIAKAARITSSFPAAFPPQYALSPGFPEETLKDQKNKLSFWYFDGGVLDNKPLGHAIDHMESTGNEGGWWFFFVDPDPEKDEVKHREWGDDPADPPDPAATLASVLDVRGAETIYHDLRRIQKINHQVMQVNDFIVHLWKHLCEPHDQTGRMQELFLEMESSVITSRMHRFLPDYLKCVTMLRYRFGESPELRKKQEWVIKAVKPCDLKKIISECRANIAEGSILGSLSSENRENLAKMSNTIEDSPSMKRYEAAVKEVSEKQLLFRQITFWVEDDYSERKQLAQETKDAFEQAWRDFEVSLQLLDDAYAAVVKEIRTVVADPELVTAITCFVRINEAVRAVSGIETREKIQVVKLYHNAEQYGPLAGANLGHFAGFLDRRWRRNDYLMGMKDTREMLEGKMKTFFPADFWKAYDAWHVVEDKRINKKYQLRDEDALNQDEMSPENLSAAKTVPQVSAMLRTFQKLINKYDDANTVFGILKKFKITWLLTAVRAFLWLVKQATAVPSADASGDICKWSRFKAGARQYLGCICLGIIIGMIISFFLPDAVHDLAHFLWSKLRNVFIPI